MAVVVAGPDGLTLSNYLTHLFQSNTHNLLRSEGMGFGVTYCSRLVLSTPLCICSLTESRLAVVRPIRALS